MGPVQISAIKPHFGSWIFQIPLQQQGKDLVLGEDALPIYHMQDKNPRDVYLRVVEGENQRDFHVGTFSHMHGLASAASGVETMPEDKPENEKQTMITTLKRYVSGFITDLPHQNSSREFVFTHPNFTPAQIMFKFKEYFVRQEVKKAKPEVPETVHA